MSQVVISWSGGKESCFACYKAISKGFKVSHLLNFISPNGRCRSHGLSSKLIVAQSEAIGIPIVQRKVTWKTYEKEFKSVIHELKQSGVEGAVFGDLSNIAGHEGWIDSVCSELDIKPIKPLWNSDPEQLLTDFVAEGFKALIVMVKADLFGKEWLGRKIDEAFVRDLRQLDGKVDIHPCGELGEYHTFVYDGPLFERPIRILESKEVFRDKKYWYLDITRYEVLNK